MKNFTISIYIRRLMNGRILALMLSCFFGSPLAAQSGSSPQLELPNLEKLSEAEKVQFYECHNSLYLGLGCTPLVERVCSLAANRNNWTCLTQRFDKCKPTDFQGQVQGIPCQEVLKKVCNDTRDQWDHACDGYRYEQCLAQKFDGFAQIGEGEENRKSCRDVRVDFALPYIEKAVAAIEKSDQSRPFQRTNSRHEATWPKSLCQMAGADKTHPFQSFCEQTLSPLLAFEDFYSIYNRIRPTDPERVAKKLALFEATLRLDSQGQPLIPAGKNPWDGIGATAIWLGEMDSPHQEIRRAAAKLLDKHGEDSFMVNFLLLRASQDDDPAVRMTGLRGLANRTYRSGLVMTVLAQAMNDQAPAIRALGFAGIARRWNSDAQGGYAKEVGRALVGLFPCSTAMSPSDIKPLADAPSLDELRRLKPVDYFCSFGVGVNLLRFRSSFIEAYVRAAASSEFPEEKAAALQGLKLLVGESEKTHMARLARQALNDQSGLVRRAALSLLGQVEPNSAQVYDAIKAEIESSLFNASRPNITEIAEAFSLLVAQKRTTANPVPDMPYDPGNALPLYTSCVASRALPHGIRNWCFEQGSTPFPFPDYHLEKAYIDAFREILAHGNHADKQRALEFLLNGTFRFRTDEWDQNQNVRRLVIQLLEAQLTPLFARMEVDGRWSHAAQILRTLSLIDRDAYQKYALELGGSRPIKRFVEAALHANTPLLPMKEWFDRYYSTRQDLIERREFSPSNPGMGGTMRLHSYLPHRWVEDEIQLAFSYCSRTGNGLDCTSAKRQLPDIALMELSDLREVFFDLYKIWKDNPRLDKKKEFWGITDSHASAQ